MSEPWPAIIGCMLTFVLSALLMATGWLLRTVLGLDKRLVKIETINSLYSERVATVLHSPHTPEMDVLLEKFRDEYIRRHYELTPAEWQKLAELTEAIVNDELLAKGERQLAAWINAVCAHKLLKDPKPYPNI
jgi:hypothetical protein